MTKRLLFLLSLVVLSILPLQAGPPGIEVQWNYDANSKTVALHLTNTSAQDITAYNISAVIKHNDGTADSSEMLDDFLPLMASVVADQSGYLRTKNGDGTFRPGTSRDKTLLNVKDVSNVLVIADVIVYADRTAEVANSRAFDQLVALRKGMFMAAQQAQQVLKQADTSTNAANELTRLAEISKGRSSGQPDAPESHMEMTLRNLATQARTADLSQLSKDVETRIALYGAHAQLLKNGGQQ